MLVTDFTTYEDIRLCLGIRFDELNDEDLALEFYSLGLESEFYDIDPLLLSELERVNAIEPPTNMTSQEVFLKKSAKLFATYAVAKQVCEALPLLNVFEISDSKGKFQRHSSAYKDTVASINTKFQQQKVSLAKVFGSISGDVVATTPVLPYLTVSSPLSDPVIGT